MDVIGWLFCIVFEWVSEWVTEWWFNGDGGGIAFETHYSIYYVGVDYDNMGRDN